ncbi:MAG: hypothetical protein RR307_04240 [Clostridia bacterium]
MAKKRRKTWAIIIDVMACIFCLIMVFITIMFVSSRNHRGHIEMFGFAFFAQGDSVFTAKIDSSLSDLKVGDNVAYEAITQKTVLKAGTIEQIIAEDGEMLKFRVSNSNINVSVFSIKGRILSQNGGAALFSFITSQTGFIISVALPSAILMIYYIIILFRIMYHKDNLNHDNNNNNNKEH